MLVVENAEVSAFFERQRNNPFEGWSDEATGDCFLWVVVLFLP